MINAFFKECFISGLKDEIRAQVLMACPQTWLEATKCAKEAQQVVFSQNRKPSFVARPRPTNPALHATPLKIQKLTWVEMDEHQLKGLFYNCDDKYFPEHKSNEQMLFMAILRMLSTSRLKLPPWKSYPQQMILIHLLIHQKLNR
jgi:hypothetical protein